MGPEAAGAPREGRGLFAVLLPTLECNLGCAYCFEDHPAGRWTDEATARVIREVVSLAADLGRTSLRLHWQGGEPLLLGTEYWARTLGLAREEAGRRGIRLSQAMQTNLLLWDPGMAPLVREHMGGSLGTSFESEAGRCFPGGDRARFEREWVAALARAEGEGIEVGVLWMLGPEALGRGAGATLDLASGVLGIRRLRLVLPFEAGPGAGIRLDPAAAGRFLAEAVRWWWEGGGDRGRATIRPFSHLRDAIRGVLPREGGLCLFSAACADDGLAVGPGGEVALCDCFLGRPRAAGGTAAVYGNVLEGPLAGIVRSAARDATRSRVAALVGDECMGCRWLAICHGGCLVRAVPRADGTPRYHYCEATRMMLEAMEGTVR